LVSPPRLESFAKGVLEYVERGEIKWRDRHNRPILTVNEIRPMIRDVVLGLEYIHFQGIIHRDIKPGNLLITHDGTVKISDFGVSHLAKMDEAGNLLPENDLDLAKTAGSPAFFAPELCQFETRPVITKAIDVWALGVTFYCLLFGREPFPDVQSEMELYHKICTEEIEPPADQADRIDADTKDLLKRLLTKDPKRRIPLPQVRRHPFITKDIPNPKSWIECTDLTKVATPLEVTPQEVESAVTSFRNIFRRTLAQVKMTAKRSMSYLRPRQATGRFAPDHASPVIAATTPNSPTSILSAQNLLRIRAPTPSRSPVSDVTDIRPKVSHAYFESIARSAGVTPPTPPHSSKIEPVLPNGHLDDKQSTINDRVAIVSGKSPLTPPPPPATAEHPPSRHLNDDYSNIHYVDSDFDEDGDLGGDAESDEEDDDGDRLEMRFGAKKQN
jgi:serine/threonine protein kinase